MEALRIRGTQDFHSVYVTADLFQESKVIIKGPHRKSFMKIEEGIEVIKMNHRKLSGHYREVTE